MCVFIILVKFRLLSGHLFGKIAAHPAFDMFSWYKYLIVNLVFSPSRFLELESFSDCAFS